MKRSVVVAALVSAAGILLPIPNQAAGAAPSSSLVGHLDSATGAVGQVVLRGWAADTRVPHSSVDIRYSIRFGQRAVTSGAYIAHQLRPDVGAAFPALGSGHGFVLTLFLPASTYTACVGVVDPRGGPDKPIGCAAFTVLANHPAGGHLDSVTAAPNAHVRVTGWAADPNTPATPSTVGVFVGGTAGHAFTSSSAVANLPRSDVFAKFPSLGPNHGFDVTLPARPGTFPVCVYANDTYQFGYSVLLGCLSATV
jgi:hypothetical protein